MYQKIILLALILVLDACFFVPKPYDKDVLEENEAKPYVQNLEAVEALDGYFLNANALSGFNGVVYVSDNGNEAFYKAYGYNNIKLKTALQTNDVFQIASISKPITAAAILILEHRGLLSIKDNVKKYLPDFPYNDISIESLLTHKSGLFNYMYFADEKWIYKDSLLTMDRLYSLIVNENPNVYYLPNKRFSYSNTGYYLLAYLVEKISETPFETFLEKEIFKPLGMKNTYLYQYGMVEPPSNLVMGHDKFNRYYPPTYLNTVYGDKGILSTAKDLALFNEGITSGKIIPFDSISKGFSPIVKTGDKGKYYGYGWRITTRENGELLTYHTGWWQGYKGVLLRLPNVNKTVVVLSNSTKSPFFNVEELANLVESAFSTDAQYSEPL